jgi:heat shock protein HslJ
MKRSGRTTLIAVLPLLLFGAACTEPVINIEEPEEVDSCGLLIPIGIELVNDYVYTLLDADLGSTGGDVELLPTEIIALNARGAQLDVRAVELGCDVVVMNQAIADATAGIESDDPLVAVFLESVRGGIVAPVVAVHGEWILESGSLAAEELTPLADHPITLVLGGDAASGYAGCNGYFYPATLADGIWTWGEATATITELSCIDEDGNERTDVMGVEVAFTSALEQVAAYELTNDDGLVLTGDGVELRFVRSPRN